MLLSTASGPPWGQLHRHAECQSRLLRGTNQSSRSGPDQRRHDVHRRQWRRCLEDGRLERRSPGADVDPGQRRSAQPEFRRLPPAGGSSANHKLILGVVSGPGAGILKSTNAGLGWQLLANSLFEGAALGSIAVHPSNPNILYVSVWWGGAFAKPGVYKSVDGGVNWQNTTSFHAGAVSDVIVARFNPQQLFAGLVRGSQEAPGVQTPRDIAAPSSGGHVAAHEWADQQYVPRQRRSSRIRFRHRHGVRFVCSRWM